MIIKSGGGFTEGVNASTPPLMTYTGKWLPWHIEIYDGVPYWEAWFFSSGKLTASAPYICDLWLGGGGSGAYYDEVHGYSPVCGSGEFTIKEKVTINGAVVVTIGAGGQWGQRGNYSPTVGGTTSVGSLGSAKGGEPNIDGGGLKYRFGDPQKSVEQGNDGAHMGDSDYCSGKAGWLHWRKGSGNTDGTGYGAGGGDYASGGIYVYGHEGIAVIRTEA